MHPTRWELMCQQTSLETDIDARINMKMTGSSVLGLSWGSNFLEACYDMEPAGSN